MQRPAATGRDRRSSRREGLAGSVGGRSGGGVADKERGRVRDSTGADPVGGWVPGDSKQGGTTSSPPAAEVLAATPHSPEVPLRW